MAHTLYMCAKTVKNGFETSISVVFTVIQSFLLTLRLTKPDGPSLLPKMQKQTIQINNLTI